MANQWLYYMFQNMGPECVPDGLMVGSLRKNILNYGGTSTVTTSYCFLISLNVQNVYLSVNNNIDWFVLIAFVQTSF